jgi:mannose-6-phosphate isomerase-like protein (cupin superfamily)
MGKEGEANRSAVASSARATGSDASPAAPGPIDGGLPSPEGFALSAKASCPAQICRREGATLEALLGAAENRSPVGIWEEDLGAGAAVTFGRRADMDVLGLALAGNVALVADESKGGGAELAPWHAFVAPGSGITLRAKGGPARLILMIVATGETPAARAAGIKASAWTARPAPIASTDLAAASDLTWGKGAYHARIGFAAETSAHASLGILKMSADGAVAPHVHEKEWELMAILRGEGDFIQGVGDGEQTVHASDGTLFSVAPGTRHQWKPAGSRPFLGIQVYTPPGPEQRFKKLAAPP